MYIVTNSFLTSAREITLKCSKPVEVLEVIKRTITKSMSLEKSRSVVNLLFVLRKSNVGTGEVENYARRFTKRMAGRHQRALVTRLMTWKIRDAIACRKKAQYENTKVWRQARMVLRQEGISKAYEALWRREKGEFVGKLTAARKTKVDFLRRKYGKDKDIPKTIRGVTVIDQEIPESFSSEPRTYGGIKLGEMEHKVLSLPPKFATYGAIDLDECRGEVEKGIAKYRWAKTLREGEQEERKEYFDDSSKAFDFGNMRACDMPFNKRIGLPKPISDEEEISLYSLKNRLKNITSEFVATTENKKHCNLRKEEKEGLKSLTRKVKDKEIVVYQTDKSGRFSVDQPSQLQER